MNGKIVDYQIFMPFALSLSNGRSLVRYSSDIEYDPRTPLTILLPDFQLVVRHAFDLGVKGVTLEIERLSFDFTIHATGLDIYHLATFADEAFKIEFGQKLGEPSLQ